MICVRVAMVEGERPDLTTCSVLTSPGKNMHALLLAPTQTHRQRQVEVEDFAGIGVCAAHEQHVGGHRQGHRLEGLGVPVAGRAECEYAG